MCSIFNTSVRNQENESKSENVHKQKFGSEIMI